MLTDPDLEEIRQGLRDGLRGPILLKWCHQFLAARDERKRGSRLRRRLLLALVTAPDDVQPAREPQRVKPQPMWS